MKFAEATLAGAGSFANVCSLCSGLRILLSPFSGRGNGLGLVLFPRLSYIICERVVWVRCTEESLDREEDGPDLKCR